MSRERQPAESGHESAVRRLVDAFNAKDLDAVLELFTDDAVLHEPFIDEPIAGKESLRRFHEELYASFPDEQLEIQQLISGGDWVVSRIVASATHTGEFLGMAPTGRRFEVQECTVFEFRDELIQTVRVYVDSGSIAKQLGYEFAPTETSGALM